MNMTKGELIVAEALGNVPKKEAPVLSEQHPFLRYVIRFMENRREWKGTASELLKEIGDSYTPPNTVTKLLNRYDYDYFYKQVKSSNGSIDTGRNIFVFLFHLNFCHGKFYSQLLKLICNI